MLSSALLPLPCSTVFLEGKKTPRLDVIGVNYEELLASEFDYDLTINDS